MIRKNTSFFPPKRGVDALCIIGASMECVAALPRQSFAPIGLGTTPTSVVPVGRMPERKRPSSMCHV